MKLQEMEQKERLLEHRRTSLHWARNHRLMTRRTLTVNEKLAATVCKLSTMNQNTQQQQQQQPFYDPLSGTTQVSRYQKKLSPTHHPDHHPIFISFFHLPRSIASSLFKARIKIQIIK